MARYEFEDEMENENDFKNLVGFVSG